MEHIGRHNPATSHDNAGIAASSYLKTKDEVEVKSFEEAKTFLGGKKERTLASNVTVIVRKGSAKTPKSIAIRLYQTDIITYHSDGTFNFTNGGWATPTTSTRCNQFGPRGFYFSHHKRKLAAWHSGTNTSFKDGDRVPVQPTREAV